MDTIKNPQPTSRVVISGSTTPALPASSHAGLEHSSNFKPNLIRKILSAPNGAIAKQSSKRLLNARTVDNKSGGFIANSVSDAKLPQNSKQLHTSMQGKFIQTIKKVPLDYYSGSQNSIKTQFFLNKIYQKIPNLKLTQSVNSISVKPALPLRGRAGSHAGQLTNARSVSPQKSKIFNGTPTAKRLFTQQPSAHKRVFQSSYSKMTEINLITISLASANRIRQWAEKTLPNGKVVGEVINPETVHYKTLKPIKGGLFCERIFGPLKDHECACGKKFNIKNYYTKESDVGELNLPPSQANALAADQQVKLQKRYFCRVCDVEYTYSIIRRTQLGYIQLASPTTHVWFVKGVPSYISILLDMKKKHLQNVTYNSETLTLEHSLRGRQFLPSSPSLIFESWQKIMKKQYPEKYGEKPALPLQGRAGSHAGAELKTTKLNKATLRTPSSKLKGSAVSTDVLVKKRKQSNEVGDNTASKSQQGNQGHLPSVIQKSSPHLSQTDKNALTKPFNSKSWRSSQLFFQNKKNYYGRSKSVTSMLGIEDANKNFKIFNAFYPRLNSSLLPNGATLNTTNTAQLQWLSPIYSEMAGTIKMAEQSKTVMNHLNILKKTLKKPELPLRGRAGSHAGQQINKKVPSKEGSGVANKKGWFKLAANISKMQKKNVLSHKMPLHPQKTLDCLTKNVYVSKQNHCALLSLMDCVNPTKAKVDKINPQLTVLPLGTQKILINFLNSIPHTNLVLSNRVLSSLRAKKTPAPALRAGGGSHAGNARMVGNQPAPNGAMDLRSWLCHTRPYYGFLANGFSEAQLRASLESLINISEIGDMYKAVLNEYLRYSKVAQEPSHISAPFNFCFNNPFLSSIDSAAFYKDALFNLLKIKTQKLPIPLYLLFCAKNQTSLDILRSKLFGSNTRFNDRQSIIDDMPYSAKNISELKNTDKVQKKARASAFGLVDGLANEKYQVGYDFNALLRSFILSFPFEKDIHKKVKINNLMLFLPALRAGSHSGKANHSKHPTDSAVLFNTPLYFSKKIIKHSIFLAWKIYVKLNGKTPFVLAQIIDGLAMGAEHHSDKMKVNIKKTLKNQHLTVRWQSHADRLTKKILDSLTDNCTTTVKDSGTTTTKIPSKSSDFLLGEVLSIVDGLEQLRKPSIPHGSLRAPVRGALGMASTKHLTRSTVQASLLRRKRALVMYTKSFKSYNLNYVEKQSTKLAFMLLLNLICTPGRLLSEASGKNHVLMQSSKLTNLRDAQAPIRGTIKLFNLLQKQQQTKLIRQLYALWQFTKKHITNANVVGLDNLHSPNGGAQAPIRGQSKIKSVLPFAKVFSKKQLRVLFIRDKSTCATRRLPFGDSASNLNGNIICPFGATVLPFEQKKLRVDFMIGVSLPTVAYSFTNGKRNKNVFMLLTKLSKVLTRYFFFIKPQKKTITYKLYNSLVADLEKTCAPLTGARRLPCGANNKNIKYLLFFKTFFSYVNMYKNQLNNPNLPFALPCGSSVDQTVDARATSINMLPAKREHIYELISFIDRQKTWGFTTNLSTNTSIKDNNKSSKTNSAVDNSKDKTNNVNISLKFGKKHNLYNKSFLNKPSIHFKKIKLWHGASHPWQGHPDKTLALSINSNSVSKNPPFLPALPLRGRAGSHAGVEKNVIVNNIYCLSHRELWEQEKDWQDFAYYYYAPTHITDIPIPLYKNRNYDLLFNIDNTLAYTATENFPKQNQLYSLGMNINTAFSGAGLIQKLLNEFNYTELKKMDKQNRILLFEYNKHVKKLKKMMNSRLIKSRLFYYKACHIRDLLIRRTKLTRKIFNKVLPTKNIVVAPESVASKGLSSYTNNYISTNGLNMILTLLPVLPPVLRPVLKMSGQFTISDLNRLYQRIIYRNERLKKFLKDPALSSSFEMKYAQRLLQEAVDNLIQNGKSGVVPEKDARGRLLKSLSDILKGKQGRFRQYLLGKRVDYSGRSVIVVGPRLKLHECGIPKEMALVLYSPFLIKRILNQKLADTYLSAKKLIQTNPLLVSQLLREIMKSCPVLLNRAPTLHRLGFQAFQPKLVDGKAILLHPLVCPAFNADFDGDQMAVHVPITFEARAEAWKLMLARNNLLSPATGEPLILPSQDMVLGCYYLTTNCAEKWSKFKKGSGMYFHSIHDVLKAYNQQLIHVHAVIWVNIEGHIENGNNSEQPLEIRLQKTKYKIQSNYVGGFAPAPRGEIHSVQRADSLAGSDVNLDANNLNLRSPNGGAQAPMQGYIEIYTKSHNFVNLKKLHLRDAQAPIRGQIHDVARESKLHSAPLSVKIIRTTPGKILFNMIIKNAIEKRPALLSKYTSTGLVKNKLINTFELQTDNFFKRTTLGS